MANPPPMSPPLEIPEVFEAVVCASEVALPDTHSAHDAFAHDVVAHETTERTNRVAAMRGRIPVHFLNGPQVPPDTLAEHRRHDTRIALRIHPDAGRLLFLLK